MHITPLQKDPKQQRDYSLGGYSVGGYIVEGYSCRATDLEGGHPLSCGWLQRRELQRGGRTEWAATVLGPPIWEANTHPPV